MSTFTTTNRQALPYIIPTVVSDVPDEVLTKDIPTMASISRDYNDFDKRQCQPSFKPTAETGQFYDPKTRISGICTERIEQDPEEGNVSLGCGWWEKSVGVGKCYGGFNEILEKYPASESYSKVRVDTMINEYGIGFEEMTGSPAGKLIRPIELESFDDPPANDKLGPTYTATPVLLEDESFYTPTAPKRQNKQNNTRFDFKDAPHHGSVHWTGQAGTYKTSQADDSVTAHQFNNSIRSGGTERVTTFESVDGLDYTYQVPQGTVAAGDRGTGRVRRVWTGFFSPDGPVDESD